MVIPFVLIFMTQWMLLITQFCVGWHCTDCKYNTSMEQSSDVEYNMLITTDSCA